VAAASSIVHTNAGKLDDYIIDNNDSIIAMGEAMTTRTMQRAAMMMGATTMTMTTCWVRMTTTSWPTWQ
jgi:hypothetical protein